MGDELDVVGFVPSASKLHRPKPGLVPRTALVERVRAYAADVVTVTAPAGYGKSTFVAELSGGDPRPTAWVSLTAAEDDPAALLTYIALALDGIEPVDPRGVSVLWSRAPTIGSLTLHQFVAMFAVRRPFMLVLDDVHELTSRDVHDVLTVLVGEMPAGSSVVLAGRTAVPVPFGRIRVRRRLVEVGAADLAFDRDEVDSLFGALGVDVTPADHDVLLERTEGWPVAVYLAALAQRSGRTRVSSVVSGFAGDHRYFVEYLGEELLAALEPDIAAFLMDASCLERLSGDLCDDVLQRTGSALLLEALQDRTSLVIPLDDRNEGYRFHHLMSEFLQAELTRRDPARRAVVHRRASEWCDAHGDADGAVTHAVRSGDLSRAESMIQRWFATTATAGRSHPTSERWVAMFPTHELEQRPLLMVTAAWASFARGEPGRAVQWVTRATSALPDPHPADVHGYVPPVAVASARMIIAPLSPAEMMLEATYVYRHVGLGDGHPLSCLALGAAAFMAGDETEAELRLREGADTTLVRPQVVASCLAHLGMIHIEHGRWDEAATAARRARVLLGDATSFPGSILTLALNVLVETHAGRDVEADADRQLCYQHLTGLIDAASWLSVQARVALTRDALIRGDRVRAAALLKEAEAIVGALRGAVGVGAQLAALKTQMTPARDRAKSFGLASLTTAEQRVLRLLPTHLSMGEIADRLYVSRNTVKSHSIAIYRKLGTSSRSGAVAIAVAAGTLDTDVHPE